MMKTPNIPPGATSLSMSAQKGDLSADLRLPPHTFVSWMLMMAVRAIIKNNRGHQTQPLPSPLPPTLRLLWGGLSRDP